MNAPAPTVTTSDAMFVAPDNKALAKTLTAAGLAMSSDGTRPHLCALLIEILPTGQVALVATDGHRLHRVIIPVQDIGDARQILLHAADVKALVKLLRSAPKETPVRFSADLRTVTIKIGDTVCMYKLNDENFPPYLKVIPNLANDREPCNRIGVHSAYMIDGLKACGITDSGTKLNLGGDLDPMVLESDSPEIAEVTVVIMPMRI